MPLQPSRRDILGPPPRDVTDLASIVRHQSSYLRSLDPGMLDGRYASPRPNTPGPSLLVGGEDGGDTQEFEQILWEDGDRCFVWTPGEQVFQLSHIPIDESLILHWHASETSAGVEWKRGDHYDVSDDGAVTIYGFTRGGVTWPKRGQIFSAQYPYREGAEDETGEVFMGSAELLAWDPSEIDTGIILETGVSYRIVMTGNFCIDGPFPRDIPPCGDWNGPAGGSGFVGPQADSATVWRRAPSESATWTGPWGTSNPVQYSRLTAEGWHAWAAVRTSEFRYGGLAAGDACGTNSDVIVGAGEQLRLKFIDGVHTDNNGSVLVSVYETGL